MLTEPEGEIEGEGDSDSAVAETVAVTTGVEGGDDDSDELGVHVLPALVVPDNDNEGEEVSVPLVDTFGVADDDSEGEEEPVVDNEGDEVPVRVLDTLGVTVSDGVGVELSVGVADSEFETVELGKGVSVCETVELAEGDSVADCVLAELGDTAGDVLHDGGGVPVTDGDATEDVGDGVAVGLRNAQGQNLCMMVNCGGATSHLVASGQPVLHTPLAMLGSQASRWGQPATNDAHAATLADLATDVMSAAVTGHTPAAAGVPGATQVEPGNWAAQAAVHDWTRAAMIQLNAGEGVGEALALRGVDVAAGVAEMPSGDDVGLGRVGEGVEDIGEDDGVNVTFRNEQGQKRLAATGGAAPQRRPGAGQSGEPVQQIRPPSWIGSDACASVQSELRITEAHVVPADAAVTAMLASSPGHTIASTVSGGTHSRV